MTHQTSKKNWYGVLLALAISTPAMCAEHAPDFTLPRLDNQQTVRLSDLRGKVVYVDFWASWCIPCALSLPALQQLHDNLAASGFEVLAINLDESPQTARKFIHRFGVTYPILYDAEKTTPQRYQLAGMPTAFLVDRNGKLRVTHKGFRAGDQQKLQQQIQQLLQETTP